MKRWSEHTNSMHRSRTRQLNDQRLQAGSGLGQGQPLMMAGYGLLASCHQVSNIMQTRNSMHGWEAVRFQIPGFEIF